jgi:streptogramin lyase
MFRRLRDWPAYLRALRRRLGREARPRRRRAAVSVEPLEERWLFTIGIIEYLLPTPNTHVLGIAPAPDGNVWFTENNTYRIGKLTPGGAITEYGTGTLSPYYIWGTASGGSTAGTKRWLTETGPGNYAANSTTAGGVSSYFVDSPTGSFRDVGGITLGPDGNLWMTSVYGTGSPGSYTWHEDVDQVTPTGGITKYTADTSTAPGAGPTMGGITAFDRNLWFAETSADKVGKITLSGSVTLYSVGGQPYGITAAPDGKVYFTLEDNNKIGQIDPATGDITYWATPTANSQPHGIAVGPDNNVWLAEWGASQVAQFALDSHTFQEYATPTSGSSPDGVAGPDGNLYFTESGANQVGKLTDIESAYVRYDDPSVDGCACGGDVRASLNTGDLHVQVPLDPGAGAAAGAGLRPDTALAYHAATVNPYPIVEVHYGTDPNGSVPTQLQARLTWNHGTPEGWVNFSTSGHSAGVSH